MPEHYRRIVLVDAKRGDRHCDNQRHTRYTGLKAHQNKRRARNLCQNYGNQAGRMSYT